MTKDPLLRLDIEVAYRSGGDLSLRDDDEEWDWDTRDVTGLCNTDDDDGDDVPRR